MERSPCGAWPKPRLNYGYSSRSVWISFEDGMNAHGLGFAMLRGCHNCHQGVGGTSFTSYSRVQFEPNHLFALVHASAEAQEAATGITYLQARHSWKLLRRLMR
jgi:hypothetical protein